MATIANLLIGLGVDFGGVTKGLNRGSKNLRGGISNLRASFAGMQGILDRMQSTASRIGSALSSAIQGAARTGIVLAAEAETAQISFEVLIGDAERAAELMENIRKFAAATPFESTELRDAAKQLLAFGTSAEQVVPTLRMLGDISAGMGIPLGDLAEIYGKARAQGRLFMEDINQLGGRGINVTQVWAEQMGKTVSEIREMVSAGRFGFRELQEALQELTKEGGAFGGMMERQSGTLAGMWSTAVDNAKTAAMEFGKSLLEAFDVRDALGGLVAAFGAMEEPLRALKGTTEDSTATTAQWAESWLNGLEFVTKGLAHVVDFFKFLGDVWGLVVSEFKAGVGAMIDALAWFVEQAEAAMAKLPESLGGGATDLGASSLRAAAAAWAGEAATAWDAAIDSMSDRTNAEAVTQFFDSVRENLRSTQAVAEGAGEALELVESAATGGGGKSAQAIAAMEERLGLAKELAKVERSTAIEAATRGSSEAFTAIREFRQQRGGLGRPMEKLTEAALRELELQRENNRLIREALNNLQAAEVLN